MEPRFKLITGYFGTELIKFDEPLSFHTALRVGGPAKLFFVATNTSQIIKMVTAVRNLKLLFIIFGTGTKLMVSDTGFNGVVIKNRAQNIKFVSIKGKMGKGSIGVDEVMIEVDSGATIKSLVEFLDRQSLKSTDIINLPGSVGGNIFLSKNLQDKCEAIRVLEDGETVQIKPSELSLRKHVVLSAIFKFKSKIKV